MAQATKADRTATAKKAAATRRRNQQRATSKAAGHKAASTAQAHAAEDALLQARRTATGAARGVFRGAKSAAKLTGTAALFAGKSVATRTGVLQAAGRK